MKITRAVVVTLAVLLGSQFLFAQPASKTDPKEALCAGSPPAWGAARDSEGAPPVAAGDGLPDGPAGGSLAGLRVAAEDAAAQDEPVVWPQAGILVWAGALPLAARRDRAGPVDEHYYAAPALTRGAGS